MTIQQENIIFITATPLIAMSMDVPTIMTIKQIIVRDTIPATIQATVVR